MALCLRRNSGKLVENDSCLNYNHNPVSACKTMHGNVILTNQDIYPGNVYALFVFSKYQHFNFLFVRSFNDN